MKRVDKEIVHKLFDFRLHFQILYFFWQNLTFQGWKMAFLTVQLVRTKCDLIKLFANQDVCEH